MFECHQVDVDSAQPVAYSDGVAGMGQINHLGDGLYDSFFGNYILTPKEAGDRDGQTLGGNYYLDFNEGLRESLFTEDVYAHFKTDQIIFGAVAFEGIPTSWLDDDRFTCSYYIGFAPFDPHSFWHMKTINSETISFEECLSQDDILAYV